MNGSTFSAIDRHQRHSLHHGMGVQRLRVLLHDGMCRGFFDKQAAPTASTKGSGNHLWVFCGAALAFGCSGKKIFHASCTFATKSVTGFPVGLGRRIEY